jgi:hypothetical protein
MLGPSQWLSHPTAITVCGRDKRGPTRRIIVKVAPYHTTTPEAGEPGHRDVYHDHNDCSDGNRILPENKVSGTGGRPKCDECKTLG